MNCVRKVTISAATVEEALKMAQQEYGLLEGEFDYTVIDKGSRGFFGFMARDAVVEVRFKNAYYERRLKEFVERILQKLGPSEVKVSSIGRKFTVELRGGALKEWTNNHRDVIAAIQHLATIFVNRVSDTKLSVELDVEQLKEKRRKTLNETVEQAISKVKKGSKKVVLEPMSAGERRIIHELVKKHKNLRSYSIGVEPYRRVVIEYCPNGDEQN